MVELSSKEIVKEIMRAITEKGFLSIKKLRDYAFPEEEAEYQKVTQNQWVRYGAWLGPVLTLVATVIFFIFPFKLAARVGMDLFFYYFLILFHFLASIEVLFCLAVLLGFAVIIKFKKRSPALLLAITPVFLLRRLPIFCCIYLFMAIFYKGLLSDIGKCRQVRMVKEEIVGVGNFQPEQFWGFVPGKDSYADVKAILKNAGAEFIETEYKGNSDLPIISIKSYKAFENFGRIPGAMLYFDHLGILISMELECPNEWSFSLTAPHLTDAEQNAFSHLKEYFYSQYYPLMQKAGCGNAEDVFYTPWGVRIRMHKYRVNLTFVPFEERFTEAKKRVEKTRSVKYKYLMR